MLPLTRSIGGAARPSRSAWRETIRTEAPRPTSVSTSRLPMKPVPPTTVIFDSMLRRIRVRRCRASRSDAVLRHLLRRTRNEIKAPSEPMGLFQESCAQVELRQSAISLHDIEPDARVQLAQVDGTQVHRASIALGQVIRAIHEAMKIDAMHDAEHMRHLVRQHLAAPLQQQLFEVPRLLIIETRIVARKAVDAHAVAKRGLAEHEVPRRIRVEIFHRDTQDRVSILRHPLAQKRQDVRREQLPVMRVWMEAGRYGARCDVERRKQFHFEREEHGGESFQPLERRTGPGGELAQRLQIELLMLRLWSLRSRLEEVLEALARLGMIGEPIVGRWRRERSEVRPRLQSPAQRVRNAVRRTDGLQPFFKPRRSKCAHRCIRGAAPRWSLRRLSGERVNSASFGNSMGGRLRVRSAVLRDVHDGLPGRLRIFMQYQVADGQDADQAFVTIQYL